MPTQILISSDPWENRVAVLEDGQLAEIYFEREERVIGSIYKGRIQNVLTSMGASFVDIGLGRNAFLYVDDINKTPLNIGNVEITQGRSGYTITDKVSKGDDVLVQIVKEPRGLKGARVSTNISLPGRYLTLMPTGRYSGVSRKIGDAAERERLKNIVKRIRPDGMATIVRTAAAGVSDAELIADLGVLLRMWHGILETYKISPSPALIHKDMNLVYKAARDFVTPDVEKILIDDPDEYQNVRDFLRLLGPQYVERVEHYNHGRSLFGDFRVSEEVERLMRPRVNLPAGGSIVIETTEALTVIDVNSGNTGGRGLEDMILRTNLEAAAEIARQVRLRDIGGIIVCDFIDMSSEAARNKVLAMLENGLRRDRTRTTIQSFSALGLLEFTRKRVGKDLSQQLRGACPTCNGLGSVLSPETVAIDTLRQLRQMGHTHENGKAVAKENQFYEVVAAPSVGAQLDFWYEDELLALESSMHSKVMVRVDQALHPERTKVESLHKLPKEKLPRVGDEIEVELIPSKLPNPTSALASIDGHLIEVEGAANAAGRTIKIKVIDVDDDGNILAEPRVAVVELEVERKRRRRGGRGRGKRELTVDEQTEELLELAEEAAKGAEARPAIGISTAVEAEAEDAALRVHPLDADDAAPAAAMLDTLADATAGGLNGDARKRRRRRRRGGRRDDASGAGPVGQSGPAAVYQPGTPGRQPPASAEPAAAGPSPETSDRPSIAAANGVPPAGNGVGPAGEDGVRRRRRRRRRGRGRGFANEGVRENGVSENPEQPAEEKPSGATPERTLFRAGTGGIEHTGQVAPPQPGRAIEARTQRPIALEAPPPSLTAPQETAKVAKPTRRRTTKTAAPTPESLTAAQPMAALPAPSSAEPSEKPKRKTATRAKKSSDSGPAAAAASTAEAAAEKPKRRTTRTAKSAEDAPAKPASKAVAKKTSDAKAPPARKTATARKSTAAAKTTTTRRKKSS